ncbi:hypothetical protein [Carp edema virus]|nr:hypothetical protein [Carp edema virus]
MNLLQYMEKNNLTQYVEFVLNSKVDLSNSTEFDLQHESDLSKICVDETFDLNPIISPNDFIMDLEFSDHDLELEYSLLHDIYSGFLLESFSKVGKYENEINVKDGILELRSNKNWIKFDFELVKEFESVAMFIKTKLNQLKNGIEIIKKIADLKLEENIEPENLIFFCLTDRIGAHISSILFEKIGIDINYFANHIVPIKKTIQDNFRESNINILEVRVTGCNLKEKLTVVKKVIRSNTFNNLRIIC